MTTTDQQRYSCQVCDRDDLTLTKNGRVRSHAANGKKASEDNPACGGGSDFPVQSTELHTHRFEYGDDGHGHSGSVCTVDGCGMAEPDEKPESDPVPPKPNPFRDPLPGGVHDNSGMVSRPHEVHHEEDHADPPAPRPAGPVSAGDFLDGADDDYAEPADDGGRSYWPARYDGECSNCFAHFDAGDLIRKDDSGGYEAKECCGEGATPQPDRPKSVARTLPVVRGRYKLPDPETGKPVSASRSSKFAEGIADSFALDQWRHRMILVGVLNDPEILEKVRSGIRDLEPLAAVKIRRSFLNDRAEDAMSAAGGDIRSGKGTTLHKFTEEVDAGQRELENVPKEFRPDATAYRLALAECGFRPVKGLIERSVFSREMNVCGTFDRVLECVRDTGVLDLDGRMVTIHAGEFVIGDVKSGDNIEHPWLEILIQEALYAHAINENGVAVQDEPGGPFRWVPLTEFGVPSVREDVGVVMHVPYGSGECHFYAADLITGWRGAKICRDNRDFWKIKLPKIPIATFAVTDGGMPGEPVPDEEPNEGVMGPVYNAMVNSADTTAVEDVPPKTEGWKLSVPVGLSRDQWEELFRSATTREQANEFWRRAKDANLPGDEINRLIELVILDGARAAEEVARGQKPQTAVSGPGSSRRDEPVAETGGSRPPAAQRQDGPSLTERAHAVTTKAEASAVWHEAKAKINEMPEEKRPAAREYLTKLEGIMKERLTTAL
jgi:hypothetical protein